MGVYTNGLGEVMEDIHSEITSIAELDHVMISI